MSDVSVYRDESEGLRARYRELLQAHLAALDAVPAACWQVYARRRGRIAFGVALVAAWMAMAVVPVVSTIAEGGIADLPLRQPALTCVLMGGWGVALLAFEVARRLAPGRLRARVTAALAADVDLHAAVARLEHEEPSQVVGAAAERLERASVSWPLTGVALALPLSIHFVVAAVGSAGAYAPLFDMWITFSVLIVGHCHLVLAGFAARLGRKLAAAPTERLEELARSTGWTAWCYTVCSSIMPGVVLMGVPVVIVAVTGLLFVPQTFRGMGAHLARERRVLAEMA